MARHRPLTGLAAATVSVAVSLLVCVSPAAAETFRVANTTPDCKDGSRATHQVCLPEGKTVSGAPSIAVVSRNGNRADVESQGPVPGRPNCWQIVTVVQPLGEDCIRLPLGNPICNCRGRGWLELEVTLTPQ